MRMNWRTQPTPAQGIGQATPCRAGGRHGSLGCEASMHLNSFSRFQQALVMRIGTERIKIRPGARVNRRSAGGEPFFELGQRLLTIAEFRIDDGGLAQRLWAFGT